MVITSQNIWPEYYSKGINPVVRSRIIRPNDKFSQYILLNTLTIKLSNNDQINIPAGFLWDLSSVPRIFWPIVPPDGDFEIAALIHDYIYQNKTHSRAFADKEMLTWSRVVNTTRKISIKKIDNFVRYYCVRLFGWIVWNKKDR